METNMQIKLPKRFSAFLVTQSLGAFNDNLFKMLLQLYVIQLLVPEPTAGLISQALFLDHGRAIWQIDFPNLP